MHMVEIDILRRRKRDLTKGKLRAALMKDVAAYSYHVVVASPPCSTFSRAIYSGRPGPQPYDQGPA